MPGTCWAAGQGPRSFSLDKYRSQAQEMLNIKGHGLNCPAYLAGLTGRGFTPGCEEDKQAKEGSLSNTLVHSKLAPGAIRWLTFGHFSPLTPGWDSGSRTGHANAHSGPAAFPLLAPGLRTPLQKDPAHRWFCNCKAGPRDLFPHPSTYVFMPSAEVLVFRAHAIQLE